MGPSTQAVNGGCSLTQLKDKDTQECTHTRTPGTLDELQLDREMAHSQTNRAGVLPTSPKSTDHNLLQKSDHKTD